MDFGSPFMLSFTPVHTGHKMLPRGLCTPSEKHKERHMTRGTEERSLKGSAMF